MRNQIVYGPSQSGILALGSIFSQKANTLKNVVSLGQYFDVFGDRYIGCDSSGKLLSVNNPKEVSSPYFVSACEEDGQIKIFHDYNPENQLDSESELSKRRELLHGASRDHSYVLFIKSWEDAYDKGGFVGEEIQDDKNDLIVILPDNPKEFVADYGLAHVTKIWGQQWDSYLDLKEKFHFNKNIEKNLRFEIEAFAKRLKELKGRKNVTYVNSSDIFDLSRVAEIIGQPQNKIIKEQLSREPRYRKNKINYFSNPREVEDLASYVVKKLNLKSSV